MAFIQGFTGSSFPGISVGSLNQSFPQGLSGPSFASAAPSLGPQGVQQLLMQVLVGLTQLMGGWGGIAGGQQPQQFGFGLPQQQLGGFGFPPQQQFGLGFPQQQQFGFGFPQQQQFGLGFGFPQQQQSLGGGLMTAHTDPNELASYLQAQLAGGALQGNTTVNQSDAIPGTRFGQVADPTQWHASVARAYAYQFAGQAFEYDGGQGRFDPLSREGLGNAALNFGNLTTEAQLFAQVASVFKGNMHNGPGNYDNGILKDLLLSKGLTGLANQPQVGLTDVQTIGAITNALNKGQLSLQEVLDSGAISQQDMPRYLNIISYVQNGNFNQDLANFDANPVR